MCKNEQTRKDTTRNPTARRPSLHLRAPQNQQQSKQLTLAKRHQTSNMHPHQRIEILYKKALNENFIP